VDLDIVEMESQKIGKIVIVVMVQKTVHRILILIRDLTEVIMGIFVKTVNLNEVREVSIL